MRFYGRDLRTESGLRRVRALIAGLPRQSAFWRARAPKAADWATAEELLASLIEVTDAGWRLFAKANGAQNTGQPLKVPRPDDGSGTPRTSSRRSVAHFFRSLKGMVREGG